MLPEREEYLFRIFARCTHTHQEVQRIADDIVRRNDRTHRFGLRVVAREQVARRRKADQGDSLDQARTSCPFYIGFGRRVSDDPAIEDRAHPAWINMRRFMRGIRTAMQ